MCIAIYKPAGITIKEDVLQQCFKANPDGAGFMYVDEGKLIISKGFFTFEDFYEAYKNHLDKQCAIHFRIKTHGDISSDNCHPFEISKNIGVIHNGVISGFGKGKESDTNEFVELILKPLVEKYGTGVFTNDQIKYLIQECIGWSKLVFLDRKGNFQIYNESKGNWSSGVWFSNYSWQPPKVNHYPSTYVKPHHTYEFPKEFFISKKKGKDIYKGDLVMLTQNHNQLKKEDLVEVIFIYSSNGCTVQDMEGVFHYNVSGNILEHIDDDYTV